MKETHSLPGERVSGGGEVSASLRQRDLTLATVSPDLEGPVVNEHATHQLEPL